MALQGFPVIWSNSTTKPELMSWEYMSEIPALAARMNVDEAHGYMGVANYKALDPRSTLGRIYVLLVRKGRLAWQIALCFRTACFRGVPEEMLNSNDHNRAGAVLGTLRLGDI